MYHYNDALVGEFVPFLLSKDLEEVFMDAIEFRALATMFVHPHADKSIALTVGIALKQTLACGNGGVI